MEFFGVLAPKIESQQTPLLGERLLDRADHFGEGRPSTSREGHHMTVAGDIDSRSILRAFDTACAMIGEQLGMDRSSKNAEYMFCNGWSDR